MALTSDDLKAFSELLDEKLDKRLTPISARLDSIEHRLDSVELRLDSMEHRLDSVELRLDSMEHRLDSTEHRLGKLDADIAELKIGQSRITGDLIKLDRKMTDTYNLALDAWGRGVENRT